jgi:hypothetical protein
VNLISIRLRERPCQSYRLTKPPACTPQEHPRPNTIWAPGTDHPAGLPSVSVSSLVESIVQHQPLGRILAFDHTASSKNPFLYVISQPVLQRVDGPILVPYGFIEKTETIATEIVFFAINHFRHGRQRQPTQAARSGEPVRPEAVHLERTK